MGEGATNETTPGRVPVPWLPIIAVVVVASPVLEAVRRATEPGVGDWGAFGLGVLAASVVGLLVLSAANWIIRR
jgi:sorbitol-specific phosphotransferase system component IIBC